MEWFRNIGRFTSGKSQRFALLLAGLLVSLFAGIFVTTSVFAADATWNNQTLEYGGRSYHRFTNQAQIEKMNLSSSVVYAFHDTTSQPERVYVISFDPDANISTAESAVHTVFTFDQPSTYKKESSTNITTEPAGENSEVITSECGVEGIGWIICPTTTLIAKGMDGIYQALTGFLESQPLNVSDRTSGMFVVWNIVRGIANVVFIIMFLIIIFSHITSIGISNYGIKKTLPRLIISAILVNLSYYICAIAIDLSNITGQAVQDLFISVRNTTMTTGTAQDTGNGVAMNFETVTAAVLGGAAGTGAFIASYSGVSSAALISLVPLLLGLLVTVLVVLLVLAARQALIVILTILSPLAFVAYLLPGTSKLFDKWKDLFITMLIFFPAFSAVFGGSQLAAAIILQNATSVMGAILGLGIQVAPLALAPLILKLSGGLLNRFAGIINNPSKGLIDKTKKWSDDISKRQINARSRGIDPDKLKRRHFLRRAGRGLYQFGRKQEELTDNYQKKADAAYEATGRHAEMDMMRREIEHSKQITERELDIKWNGHLEVDTKALEKDLKLRVLTDKSELGKVKLDNRYEETKAGVHPTGFVGPLRPDDPISEIRDITQHLAAQGLRKNNAQRVLNKQLAENMLADKQLQKEAGGIYEFGADAAVASAVSTMRNEYGKSVEEGAQIIKHFNLSASDRQKHALGESVTVTDSHGNSRTFGPNDVFTRESVIEEQIAVGTVDEVAEIIAISGKPGHAEYRTTISAALAKSGVKGKAPVLGGKLIEDIAQGRIQSENDLTKYIEKWLAEGKYKPEDIAATDLQGIGLLKRAVNSNLTGNIDDTVKSNLKETIDRALTEDELSSRMAQNAKLEFTSFKENL